MDPQLLTEALRSAGHLDDAEVTSVELTPIQTTGIGSEFLAAVVRYSKDQVALPERMMVKRPLVGDRGRSEADAYQQILGPARNDAVMPCYAVVDEDGTSPLALFLPDLHETHRQTRWPVIPEFEWCQQAVQAIAQVHATWWGADLPASTPVMAHQDAEHLAAFLPRFVDYLRGYLSGARLSNLERVLGGIDAAMAARQRSAPLTLLHNDAHFWNFLYPHQASERCLIFDWPLWRPGLGGVDLAYMIALHLYPEHRERFEPRLLDAYAQALEEAGVRSSRQEVELDYRLGVAFCLLMPLMEFSWKNPPSSWLPKVEKGLSAFDELGCRELV